MRKRSSKRVRVRERERESDTILNRPPYGHTFCGKIRLFCGKIGLFGAKWDSFTDRYGVALDSRIDKFIGLFCKRAL